jgi:hypothetical protein
LTLKFRFAQSNDVALLAKLNRELIEEEQVPNPMSVDELNERMTMCLEADAELASSNWTRAREARWGPKVPKARHCKVEKLDISK